MQMLRVHDQFGERAEDIFRQMKRLTVLFLLLWRVKSEFTIKIYAEIPITRSIPDSVATVW